MDKITSLRPDMAIVSPGANRKEDIESLASSGVEVILLDGESVAQALRSIKDLGIVLNKRTEAEKTDYEDRVRDIDRRGKAFHPQGS